jgi:regulator of protease activity HflC (stomatin/prohibitin superfamily)
VKQSNAAVIESCGAYKAPPQPAGCFWMIPCVHQIAATVSLRICQIKVSCETKTKDNVFVTCEVAVQYKTIMEHVYEAHYNLSEPRAQIRSYVEDVIRGSIPAQTLDHVFAAKNELSEKIMEKLTVEMKEFGFEIIQALITDLAPDMTVKAAMNEINAQTRLKNAATAKAEGEKIVKVKQAEAEKEAKYLSGLGVAQQRKAIVDGLKNSIEDFSGQGGVPGTTPKDVMDLLLLTQYFDALKDIGTSGGPKTLFVPHAPGAVGDLQRGLREGLMSGLNGKK